jgi:O-glycosyl hydrolase
MARHLGLRRLAAIGALVAIVGASACSSSKKSAMSTPTTAGEITMPRNLKLGRISGSAQQTIDGFGASGAWWPIDLASFPDAVQRQVGQMLFSQSGIALSGYRYNVGGGGKGVTNPSRAPKQYPDDTAGLRFLQLAHDAGVPILTGFVNSAPPKFTTNGKACGGELIPGMESAYAEYLAGVVRSLRDREHVSLQYVSPMNEPDDSFPDCGQEGMKVSISQRAKVVHALGVALAREAPATKIIADETTADALTANEVPQWLASPGAAKYLAAIAHHTYDFPNVALRKLIPPISKRFERPTWMTEICCYKGSGGVASSMGPNYDPTMTQGLWLADQVEGDLSVAGDRAWYWWTALSSVLGCDPHTDAVCPDRKNTQGFNDGLLYYDKNGPTDGVTTIFTTKRFYVFGQFSRYVRPGAVRHDVIGMPNGVHAMAFASGHDWTVVTWNETAREQKYGLRMSAQGMVAGNATVTDATRNLSNLAPAQLTTTGVFVLDLPARSVATYSFGL